MIVSIITAVLNNRSFIESSINSVLSQTYPDIEHIIIDGGSTDGTLEVIKEVISRESGVKSQKSQESRVGSQESESTSQKSRESENKSQKSQESRVIRLISEPDNGMYDALNKGIRMATGDVIGFLHADDLYANDRVIERIASEMTTHNVDSCYGDLLYVDKNNTERIIRYWKSRPYEHGLFERGWMPPHPTFFVKKEIYDRYGLFNTDFKIASDYELMLRFLDKERISTCYIPEVLVKMRVGGASNRSLKNILIKTAEDYRAWRVNHLERKFYTIPLKNLSKIPQFFLKQ